MMRVSSSVVIAIIASLGAAACTSPGGAPRSAETPIPATTDGLLQFFVAECIEQRNLAWVREESERLRASRCGFLQGPGEEGDCRQRNDGVVSWRAPTTAGSELIVTMFWPIGQSPNDPYGPPEGHLSCSVAAPEALGHGMQEMAFAAAEANGLGEPRVHIEPGFKRWLWSPMDQPTIPQLVLLHIEANDPDRRWELSYQFGRYPED